MVLMCVDGTHLTSSRGDVVHVIGREAVHVINMAWPTRARLLYRPCRAGPRATARQYTKPIGPPVVLPTRCFLGLFLPTGLVLGHIEMYKKQKICKKR